ncbi:Transcriptional regulator, LuxR family [Candidatus Rhodobacter oscarellae]|uniref:Transcriptional regulator, LuxR family n=1 Tax=Candidatus Rhodobacter oscarellae TaxID=1675527 RepID=A0A0J9EB81_9RHOB|nr:LuxR C-terminal-related transcriptional regulator [Candidatus Rhodobacter lobularis]KMW59896.1 Transcriptional regulator, LuxR family [Candidatus Rhodobacter lobularis]
MTRLPVLIAILVVQALCAGVFLWDLLSNIFSLRTTPISWQTRELMEIGAAIGLLMGLAMGGLVLYRAHRRSNRVEAQLRVASGAFAELLNERFAEWGLTKAERDVALFAIKGLSLQEIAQMRNTSEGTVKAQTNAIYRKAGVNGRPQLLSVFIEDLLADPLVEGESPAE